MECQLREPDTYELNNPIEIGNIFLKYRTWTCKHRFLKWKNIYTTAFNYHISTNILFCFLSEILKTMLYLWTFRTKETFYNQDFQSLGIFFLISRTDQSHNSPSSRKILKIFTFFLVNYIWYSYSIEMDPHTVSLWVNSSGWKKLYLLRKFLVERHLIIKKDI